MSKLTLSDIASVLNMDPSLAKFIPVSMKVEPYEDSVAEQLLATLVSAGVSEATGPVTESGKPRMLKLSAWIAHGGPANKNGDAFLDEDLAEVATNNLFAPPYLGMVDFNHDFTPYGAWYSSRYEFDPVAGQYGILAEGTLFAWRFSDLADKVLAEQTRNGSVAVSMACLAQWIEPREAETGREYVLRKPVFLAVSVLDMPPADPNARAVGTEDEDQMQDLQASLLQIQDAGESFQKWTDAAKASIGKLNRNRNSIEEVPMDFNQLIAQLAEALDGKADELINEIKSAVADSEALKAQVSSLTEENTSLKTQVTDLTAKVEQATGELETTKVALDAKVAELTEVSTQFEALKTEHKQITDSIAQEKRAQLRESRMKQLPEVYLTILNKREEEPRERAVARLVEMSDADFADELELIKAGSSTSYAARSGVEGFLPSTTESGGSLAIDKYIK